MSKPPEDHFSPLAGAYARGRLRYPANLYSFLADLCPAHELAWDCATGTGQAATGLARHFDQVVATDLSPELLALAPTLPRISFRPGLAEDSGLPAASADLITVAQAVHWFDLERFEQEARRVLKPGGILAVWGYLWPRVDPTVDQHLELLKATLAPWWPDRSALLHGEYRDLALSLPELKAPSFAATAQWKAEDYLAHLRSWSAVRYFREAQGMDPTEPLAEKLGRCWNAAAKAVHWPLALRIYKATPKA